MSYIRVTALAGFPELVKELGGDVLALLREAGIPASAIDEADVFLPYRNVLHAIELAAATLRVPDFGLRLAERQGIEILGPIAALVQSAPTTGAALLSVSQYMSVLTPSFAVRIDQPRGEKHLRIALEILLERPPDLRQCIECVLGISMRIFRLVLGPQYSPVSVHFTHEPVSPRQTYQRHFATRMLFGEAFMGFTADPADLTRTLTSDSRVHDVVRAYLDSIIGPPGTDVSISARSIIRSLLPTGGMNLETVSKHLAVQPRTLQRQLAASGMRFEQIVDDVRRDLASAYLRDTDMSLGQITHLLGYSEQSALSRSARRWFGQSPRAARSHLRDASLQPDGSS